MIVPVILSGGSGSRLWPLSRKLYPKQFLNLVNDKSLFQNTILRLPTEVSDPLVICNEEHRFIVAEQMRQIQYGNKGIVLEPIGRNTAPAIAIAAFNFLNQNEDPTMLILSADHLIENEDKFHKSLKIASNIAQQGKMVAIGVKPNRAESGYGYIEINNSSKNGYFDIASFTEKPNIDTAQQYIDSGRYFWNSGIFIFKASKYLKELKKFEPEIFSACEKSCTTLFNDFDFIRINNEEFLKCPDKSVDYAVMEKTTSGAVVEFEGSWSDIGSWSSLWESKPKDRNNNVCEGDVTLNKVKNSYIYGANRLISVNDLSNLVIVDTQDALLVSSKKSTQDIKTIVQKLRIEKRKEPDIHRKVYRPWGYYDSIDSGYGFQVKRIFVNPGSKLSLQKHLKRAEHWVVVKGIALITCGNQVFKLAKNESTFIPKGQIHRLENTEKIPLEIIEIQTGDYLGEDDIIRLEDDYNRD